MQFRVIQQLDHHLTDVAVEIMILQCGKRQEACACHNMNAVGRATQADERCIHFPFRGGVEEGKLITLFNIAPRNHLQMFRVQDHVWIAGVIERGEFTHFRMAVASDLHRIAIGLVEQFFRWDLADDITLFLGLFCDQTSKFILCLYRKCFHRNHFGFLSFHSRMILIKAAMYWRHYTTLLNQNQ
jgi:hypothetical protein